MNQADKLSQKFGGNIRESMGVRNTAPAEGPATVPTLTPAAASPDDGRIRARDAGHMDITRIVPDPNQPRKEFDPDKLNQLAASLKTKGVLQPLRVRWDVGLAKWVVLLGERRYRAALQAGLKTVPCIFVEDELTPAEILEEQLVENCVRSDLSPVEQARAFQAMMQLNQWNAKQLAEQLHLSEATVCRALGLLTLDPVIQGKVDDGTISSSVANELRKVKDPDAQRELADRVVAERLTQDQAAAAAREVKARQGEPSGRGRKAATSTKSYTLPAGGKVTVALPKKNARSEDLQAALELALQQERGETKQKGRKAA